MSQSTGDPIERPSDLKMTNYDLQILDDDLCIGLVELGWKCSPEVVVNFAWSKHLKTPIEVDFLGEGVVELEAVIVNDTVDKHRAFPTKDLTRFGRSINIVEVFIAVKPINCQLTPKRELPGLGIRGRFQE